MKKLLALIAGALALLLGGCGAGPLTDRQHDTGFRTFQVAPDRAGIYVYRNETLGYADRIDVAIDGLALGQTLGQTFLYAEVEPGRHRVTSLAENTETLEIDLPPGAIAYIWQEVKLGLLTARTRLHRMPAAEVRQGMLETRRATGR